MSVLILSKLTSEGPPWSSCVDFEMPEQVWGQLSVAPA